jgi:hypothetical protein
VKLLPRLRQIALVGSVETFGVAIGGIAGLLIVNVLPKDQYAAYTFLIACMTLMLGISDLGWGWPSSGPTGSTARSSTAGPARPTWRARC